MGTVMSEWSKTMLTVFATAGVCLWVSILAPKCSAYMRDPYDTGAWSCKSDSCHGAFGVDRDYYVEQKTETLARYTKEACKPNFNDEARVLSVETGNDKVWVEWGCGKGNPRQ